MALSVKQSNMILQLLSNRLSGERDVVKISQILKEFESAFIVDIPTWKYDLQEYLKKVKLYLKIHLIMKLMHNKDVI